MTFLVGENGSGKSTLLEGIAAGMDAVAAGARDLRRDPTLRERRDFAAGFVFVRRRHARTRLFLRAEDVFGYTGRLTSEIAELADIEQEFSQLPLGGGRDRAMGVARGERAALTRRYGDDPDAKSHGETFLALLQTRLVPRGLYFLDEPETPLSPVRVLALIRAAGGSSCGRGVSLASLIATALAECRWRCRGLRYCWRRMGRCGRRNGMSWSMCG